MKISTACLCSLTLVALGYSTENIHGQADQVLVPSAVGLLAVSLIAAQLAAPDAYSMKTNTISDLGAQNYSRAWIMRSGFIGFGALVSTAALWNVMDGKKPLICSVPVAIYGFSMMATGIYSAAPFEPGTRYSERDADIHSVFANLAGIALTSAILGHLITENDAGMRMVHASGFTFVMLNSAMFKMDPKRQGIYQRVLWTGSLAWLTVSFSI